MSFGMSKFGKLFSIVICNEQLAIGNLQLA